MDHGDHFHNDGHDHNHSHDDGNDHGHSHGAPAPSRKPKVFCSKYTQIKGCVSGNNIKKYTRKTPEQCENICNRTDGCKGFEYFVGSGAKEVSNIY